MAAYAALVTLMNLMDQIQNHPLHSFSFDRKQFQSLLENVSFLLDFVEGHSSHGDLESQIASAAHVAEDVIESQVVDQIQSGSTIHHAKKGFRKSIKKKVIKALLAGCTYKSPTFLLDLQKIIEDMDSIKEKIAEAKEERKSEDEQPMYSMPAASSRPPTTGKATVVGFDSYLVQILDVLTAQQPSLQIISIAGMGGIGKTTLARNVFEDPFIKEHFDFRFWATISQEYDLREILLELLCCKEKNSGETVDALGEKLYKQLSGSRYLIVFDDIWSTKVWDEIKFFFPDNGSRSSIVITTRLSNMDCHSSYVMEFLDEDSCWKLFCQKAFGEDEDCPLELVRIGKKIVRLCRGLPLSIVVIGGHLRRSSRRVEYWKRIADDINSILTSGDEQCLDLLHLSYNHLPPYLKPCFLYTGVFLEDTEIDASTLTRLWVAEGFIKPDRIQTLEETAECQLKDLVDRNLILVRKWSWNGRIKTCNVHDLVRELSLRVAEREKFLRVLKLHPCPSRVAIYGDFYALKSARLRSSMICKLGQKILVEWIDSSDVGCLEAKFQQVNLRYLYLSRKLSWRDHDFYILFDRHPSLCLPPSISLLWNLQTLIFTGRDVRIIAPSEVWEMTQLRHMEFDLISLPEPPSRHDRVGLQDGVALLNLQTLVEVGNFRMSEEVCKRIPNVKKLEMRYDGEALFSPNLDYFQHNLSRFHKLESLNCHFLNGLNWRDFAMNLTFPSSLQELCLINCCLHWEVLGMSNPKSHIGETRKEFLVYKSPHNSH